MNKQFFPYELKCHFNLREPYALSPTSIYMVATIGGRQFKFASGVKIYPSQWDFTRQEALSGITASDRANNLIVSQRLIEMKDLFNTFKRRLNNEPEQIFGNIEWLRMQLNNKEADILPLQWLQNDILSDKEIVNNPSLPNCTARQLLHDIEKLERFCNEKKIKLTCFSMIDTQFVKQYTKWLEKQTKRNGEHLSRSYVNNLLTNLHSFLRRAVNSGKMSQEHLNQIIITKIKNKVDANSSNGVFLRDDEITKLANLNCSCITDEMIRDLFIIECLTGQRISDIIKVGSGSQNQCGVAIVDMVQQKTKAHISFAMPFAIAHEIIFNKYRCRLPSISRDTINRRIKRIAQSAGIDGKVIIKKHLCGECEPLIVNKRKWECITTHTGRRSFVSNLAIRGWSYELIAKYTGHRSARMVERYDCSTLADVAIFKNNVKNNPNLILKIIDLNR